jgi:preprotein translocase subunit SecA
VEAHNFDIRKHLLEYDDVMNKQRKEIYSFRLEVLQRESMKDRILDMIEDEVDSLFEVCCPENADAGEWDIKGLKDAVYGTFSVSIEHDLPQTRNEIHDTIAAVVKEQYENKEKDAGPEIMRYMEKVILLQVIDAQWKDHLLGIDHLKEGIGLRGYAQKDPLVEYKKEAFELFADMSQRINSEVLMRLFRIQVKHEAETEIKERPRQQQLVYNRGDSDGPRQPVHKERKTGRNDPCPCGSGKKYKKCCGAK